MAALEPKRPGRKSKPVKEAKIEALNSQIAGLQGELRQWKTKYEIAQAFIELERKYDRTTAVADAPGPGKKKKVRKRLRRPPRPSTKPDPS
jgi:hypothetical protein